MSKKRILILHVNNLNFENYIAEELRNRGHYVEVYNLTIDLKYKYKNFLDRALNTFTKIFLNYNKKNITLNILKISLMSNLILFL